MPFDREERAWRRPARSHFRPHACPRQTLQRDSTKTGPLPSGYPCHARTYRGFAESIRRPHKKQIGRDVSKVAPKSSSEGISTPA